MTSEMTDFVSINHLLLWNALKIKILFLIDFHSFLKAVRFRIFINRLNLS
jgi:hypothetical protein